MASDYYYFSDAYHSVVLYHNEVFNASSSYSKCAFVKLNFLTFSQLNLKVFPFLFSRYKQVINSFGIYML